MDRLEIAVEEFKTANDRYNFYREYKLKIITLAVTIIVGLFTFILKGDLPKVSYLIISVCVLITFNIVNYHSRIQAIYGGLASIAENKINLLIMKPDEDLKAMTLYENYFKVSKLYNWNLNKRKIGKASGLLMIIISLLFFEFSLIQGIELMTKSWKIILHLGFYIIILQTLIYNYFDNKKRKEVLKNIIQEQDTAYNSWRLSIGAK